MLAPAVPFNGFVMFLLKQILVRFWREVCKIPVLGQNFIMHNLNLPIIYLFNPIYPGQKEIIPEVVIVIVLKRFTPVRWEITNLFTLPPRYVGILDNSVKYYQIHSPRRFFLCTKESKHMVWGKKCLFENDNFN